MKNILSAILIVSLFCLAGCHGNDSAKSQTEKKDSSYAIIGKVTGLDTGTIFLNHRQSRKQILLRWIMVILNSTEKQILLKCVLSRWEISQSVFSWKMGKSLC